MADSFDRYENEGNGGEDADQQDRKPPRRDRVGGHLLELGHRQLALVMLPIHDSLVASNVAAPGEVS